MFFFSLLGALGNEQADRKIYMPTLYGSLSGLLESRSGVATKLNGPKSSCRHNFSEQVVLTIRSLWGLAVSCICRRVPSPWELGWR